MSDGLTSKAMEMPSLPTPFNKPLGSFNEKASPITPATGANVIYLLLNDAMMPILYRGSYSVSRIQAYGSMTVYESA